MKCFSPNSVMICLWSMGGGCGVGGWGLRLGEWGGGGCELQMGVFFEGTLFDLRFPSCSFNTSQQNNTRKIRNVNNGPHTTNERRRKHVKFVLALQNQRKTATPANKSKQKNTHGKTSKVQEKSPAKRSALGAGLRRCEAPGAALLAPGL